MPLDRKSVTPSGDEERPLWREHFPIDSVAETSRSRREFLGGLTVAGGAMACGQVALNQVYPVGESNKEGEATAFEPLTLERKLHEIDDGEAVLFHYPDHKSPCLLVKFSGDEFAAFAQKCTHLACPVIPDAESNEFHCPCLHGTFDLRTGEPIAGPPQSALARVDVAVAGDGTLTAVGFM